MKAVAVHIIYRPCSRVWLRDVSRWGVRSVEVEQLVTDAQFVCSRNDYVEAAMLESIVTRFAAKDTFGKETGGSRY